MNTTNNNPIIGKLFKNNEQFSWCIVEPGADKLLSLKKGQVFAVISPVTQIESPTKNPYIQFHKILLAETGTIAIIESWIITNHCKPLLNP